MTAQQTAVGVLAIFTDPEGDVVASVSDFDRSGYGGFTLEEAQKLRATRALNDAVIRAYCSERILTCITDGGADQIVRAMERNGWRRTVLPIGHDAPPR